MNRFIKVAMLLSLVIALLTALSLKTAEAKTIQASVKLPHCQICLDRFMPRSGGLPYAFLGAVTTVSISDVWAVGAATNKKGILRPLIEHWDGTQWSIVKSPNPSTINSQLFAIAAISASNIWSVGSFASNTNSSQTLIEHWDGSSWSIVKSPNPAGWPFNGLSGLAVISASDIWAVGNSSGSNGTTGQTLTEHWNGSKWSIVKSPNPTGSSLLNEASAVSSNDVWAVGSTFTGNMSSTLTEHWDGSAWSVVKSPNPDNNSLLNGVLALSASNVWATGLSFGSNSAPTLIEHWNGSTWSVAKNPNPPGRPLAVLDTMAASSASDIWTVGNFIEPPPSMNSGTLVEHWNGSKWSIVKSPDPGTLNNALTGIALVSPTDIWAVGGYSNSDNIEHTLTEHWNGSKWSVVPSPDVTGH